MFIPLDIKKTYRVHCKTEEEAREFLAYIEELGYVWNASSNPPTMFTNFSTDHIRVGIAYYLEANRLLFGRGDDHAIETDFDYEFCDLIVPEDDMELGDINAEGII